MAMAMRELCRSLLKLCFLTGLLFPGVRAQSPFSSVSISVNWPHSCASYCIDTYGLETGNDIGGALGCAAPYANDCYCATSSKAASIATSFFPSCASRVCDSGDLADDLSVMEEIYASYCMNNGFTQPGMTNWYNPATATTEATSSTASTASLAPGTTTKVSYVTQTTTSPPGANSAGTTLPGLVTIQATSTIYVNSAGSTFPVVSHSSGTNTVALGAGLGVGLAVVLLLAVAGLIFCLRRRRRRRAAPSLDATPAPPVLVSPSAGAAAPFSDILSPQGRREMAQPPNPQPPLSKIRRKPVSGLAEEFTGPNLSPDSVVVGNELSGENTRMEMSGEGRRPELASVVGTVSGSPPPAYVQGQQPMQAPQRQQYVSGDSRWELP